MIAVGGVCDALLLSKESAFMEKLIYGFTNCVVNILQKSDDEAKAAATGTKPACREGMVAKCREDGYVTVTKKSSRH